VLVIAGTDSRAGAGLAEDLRTLVSHGVQARIAVTAVTAQGPGGLSGSWPVPPEAVRAQIQAAGPVEAVKIGMLATASVVEAVTEALAASRAPIVLDPVLEASAGGRLLDAEGLRGLGPLLSRVALVTPNLPELEVLGGEAWARERGGPVLIKGGHGPTAELVDRLVEGVRERRWVHERRPGEHRGTGCRLATAIAARLAGGAGLEDSVDGAIRWLQGDLSG